MAGRTFCEAGGRVSARQNNYTKFLWLDLATVTSQALEYDAFTCTPYEGLNYTMFKPSRGVQTLSGFSKSSSFESKKKFSVLG